MIFRGEKPPIDENGGPILIVDDQADHRVRELTAKQFMKWGYAVLVSQDTDLALTIAEESSPVLVIIGEITVTMDIPSFLFELKARLYKNPPPICVLVGTWPYRNVNGDGFPIVSISPPISINELLNITDDLCAA